MKRMITYRNSLLLTGILLAGSLAALATWNKLSVKKTVPNRVADSTIQTADVLPDPELLARMQKVCTFMDASGKEYFISGTISTHNGADSTDKINAATYVFTKSGNDFYYRLGDTETFNSEGLNVFVDKQNRRIMVSTQKSVTATDPLPHPDKLLKNLAGEGYTLNSKTSGQNETLSLVNEQHLSCKEYSVTFNTASLRPGRLFVRISDPEDSDNKAFDRNLDLRITETGNFARKEKFSWTGIIKATGTGFETTAGYQDYQLIVL